MDEPDDFVVTLEDELFYCDLLYLADRVAGESEGVTFDANAQQALLNAAGGSMHGNIAVSGRTAVDKPLTTAQVNEALACFEGSGLIVVEGSLEGEKTLVVAYDFGITDVRVTGTGDLVVEVAAQDMSGRPLAFAEGASLSLRNGETALAATPATVEGVTTFTVPAANVPAGNLALSVSVAPAAAEEAPANRFPNVFLPHMGPARTLSRGAFRIRCVPQNFPRTAQGERILLAGWGVGAV